MLKEMMVICLPESHARIAVRTAELRQGIHLQNGGKAERLAEAASSCTAMLLP
ncbi:hypothetical protein [Enterobacter sp. UPMP2052]